MKLQNSKITVPKMQNAASYRRFCKLLNVMFLSFIDFSSNVHIWSKVNFCVWIVANNLTIYILFYLLNKM